MVERGSRLDPAADHDLEDALRRLGSRLHFPVTPDLAETIRPSIAVPARRPRRMRLAGDSRSWQRAGLWAAIALLMIAAATLLLIPPAREAVADRIGLPGVVIRLVAPSETELPAPAGAGLQLGQRVDLGEARNAVEFPIALPATDVLDGPDEIYLRSLPRGSMVSAVYRARPGLPPSPHTGVAALLTQFEGAVDGGMIQKSVLAAEPGMATLETLTINGDPAFWIEGEAHGFVYLDADGEVRRESFRLAGNVLLWQRGATIYRLEAEVSRPQALAIATSLEPVAEEGREPPTLPAGTEGRAVRS